LILWLSIAVNSIKTAIFWLKIAALITPTLLSRRSLLRQKTQNNAIKGQRNKGQQGSKVSTAHQK